MENAIIHQRRDSLTFINISSVCAPAVPLGVVSSLRLLDQHLHPLSKLLLCPL